MLLLNFDFYDIYAVLISFRANPLDSHNVTITKTLKSLIETPQNDNIISDNIIRGALAELKDIDRDHYKWVFTKNIYTYGHKIIKEEIAYQILVVGFSELLKCLDNENFDQFKDLADALHNVPIILAEHTKHVRRLIEKEVSWYRKKWDKNFLRNL